MNQFILTVCDFYSIIPVAIYFGFFYMGLYLNNPKEAFSFLLFFYLNDNITKVIKSLPYPKPLWEITRRPDGAFNTDYLSRHGPSKKDAPGFPSGHMTSITSFCIYMILRKMDGRTLKEFVKEEPLYFYINILLIILMGFARWYKKCHNIVQIIAGIIYGGITTYLYYEYVGKYLIK